MPSPPPRLSLARLPTPLKRLSRTSARLGVELWVKRDDLTGHILSGNKIRKLEFVLAEALAAGADTLITCGGLQSNHCRATAAAAAELGLACHLLLRGRPPEAADGNLFLDQLFGAEITFAEPAEYARLDELFSRTEAGLRAGGRSTFRIPTGASSVTGLWGYASAWRELLEDLRAAELKPDLLVTAVGSGGTLAGLLAGQRLYGEAVPTVGMAVALDAARLTAIVAELLRDFFAAGTGNGPDAARTFPEVHIDDGYLGEGYAIAGAEIHDTIRRLAAEEGLVLDPVYTGKAFFGLAEWIRTGRIPPGSRVLFLHTGGLFGVFPERDQLISRPAPLLQSRQAPEPTPPCAP